MKPAKDVFQAVRQRADVLDVDGGNAVAGGAGAVHGFLDRALGRTPADQQHVAFGRAVDCRRGQRGRERLQFLAALGGHLHVQLGRTGRMAQFIMLQAGGDGIVAAQDPRAGRDVLRDAVGDGQIIGLVVRDGREVGRDVLANFFQVRLCKRLDARGDGLVGKDDRPAHCICGRC